MLSESAAMPWWWARLRRDAGGVPSVSLSALAEVWTHGVQVDWGALFKGSGAQRVKLPTYAFQRERYWLKASAGAGDMASAGQSSADHPLLSAAVGLADERGVAVHGTHLTSEPPLAF